MVWIVWALGVFENRNFSVNHIFFILDGNDKDDRKRDSDESKRVKTVPEGRLYPVLSDLDTSSSEQNYTTATISEDDNKGAGVHCEEGDDV